MRVIYGLLFGAFVFAGGRLAADMALPLALFMASGFAALTWGLLR